MNEAQIDAIKADAMMIFNDRETPQEVRDVIHWYDAMLRTLAAQPMEPFGWYSGGFFERDRERLLLSVRDEAFPLYAAPVAQPSPMLSDEQIDAITRSAVGEAHSAYRKIARAILAAAGAKQAVALSPLTDEQAMRAMVNASDSLNITRVHELGGKTLTICDEAGLLELARAIELAHGIAPKPAGPTP